MPMKTLKRLAAGTLALSLFATPLANADSLKNFSQATADSVEASGRIVAAGGQIALGAVAVPLAAVGGLSEATGGAANAIAVDLWDAANAPLTVDEAVLMAQPLPEIPARVGAPGATTPSTRTTLGGQ